MWRALRTSSGLGIRIGLAAALALAVLGAMFAAAVLSASRAAEVARVEAVGQVATTGPGTLEPAPAGMPVLSALAGSDG